MSFVGLCDLLTWNHCTPLIKTHFRWVVATAASIYCRSAQEREHELLMFTKLVPKTALLFGVVVLIVDYSYADLLQQDQR